MRSNSYYQSKTNYYLIVNDNNSFYHLYSLKSASEISEHRFPWNYIKRFSDKEEVTYFIKSLLGVKDDKDLIRYQRNENDIELLIHRYRTGT